MKMDRININSCKLFKAELISDTNRAMWTLPSLFGDMLLEAEKLFGERDTSWTILGIHLSSVGPFIRFQGPGKFPYNKQIIIELSLVGNIYQACWQLAHETIHCLAPEERCNAIYLEEGIATYYQNLYMFERIGLDTQHWNEGKYLKARDLVKPLMEHDRCFLKGIRPKGTLFRDINPQDIRNILPSLSEKHISDLYAKFNEE